MVLKRQNKTRKQRKGTTTVDFALTFPLVLGVFMSMIFFVQAFLYKNTASNACFEAARKGITVGATEEDIRQEAEIVLSSLAIRQREILIDNDGDTVTVAISIPMKGNSWATGTLFPIDVSIGDSCTLRKQLD